MSKTRIWFDTEFIDDGKTIDLISIGMVKEVYNVDGQLHHHYLYLENAEINLSKASPWVQENVLPKLTGVTSSKAVMRQKLIEFVGDNPEFWSYYGAYDWVALCQLFGPLMAKPSNWPMYYMDIKQYAVHSGSPKLPTQSSTKQHNALNDAIWNKDVWFYLHMINTKDKK